MPLKKQDTNPENKKAKDVRTRYGKDNAAELNTAGEVTQKQEYKKDGLMKTAKYSVDKDA